MLAPGDRPEMTSDQQPEEAEESVASDASVSDSLQRRMKIAASEERRRQALLQRKIVAVNKGSRALLPLP